MPIHLEQRGEVPSWDESSFEAESEIAHTNHPLERVLLSIFPHGRDSQCPCSTPWDLADQGPQGLFVLGMQETGLKTALCGAIVE